MPELVPPELVPLSLPELVHNTSKDDKFQQLAGTFKYLGRNGSFQTCHAPGVRLLLFSNVLSKGL